MERIAVTGYTGFIGQRLVERLLKDGNVVYPIGRQFRVVDCDVIYHLACPSSTKDIEADPRGVMDTILDLTRLVVNGYPNTLIVNASSMGASDVNGSRGDFSPQNAYNVAKYCAEMYIKHSAVDRCINYRLPSVYGEGMSDDAYIKRCIDKTAHYPFEPNRLHYIAHVDDVVDALIDLRPISSETITLGDIYEQFTSGRRGLHRPTPNTPSA